MPELELKYIQNSLDLLRNYIESENFKGYDPYDTLNSRFPFSKFGKTISIIALQVQKRNPFNLRPILSIKKETNNMGLGLMLKTYCRLQKHSPDKNYTPQIENLFKLLKENNSKKYSNTCWGYNFDWPTSKKMIAKHTPNAVVTSFACSGIFEYFLLTGNKEAENIIKSVSDFILQQLIVAEFAQGICFSYTPLEADCCYNASLLSALSLAQCYSITKDISLLDKINKAVGFVLSKQHDDGHWNYSIDKATGEERKQIDFHQGFILDCLFDIQKLTEQKDPKVEQAIQKGAEFYFKKQFKANGQSLWRLPEEFPVDIHNQSQGIITFLKLGYSNPGHLTFAKTIAEWTIKNMQSQKGFFYYRNYPFYKIKIPYMRWSQANMFYALSELMIKNKSNA